jgi:hypothetical protein
MNSIEEMIDQAREAHANPPKSRRFVDNPSPRSCQSGFLTELWGRICQSEIDGHFLRPVTMNSKVQAPAASLFETHQPGSSHTEVHFLDDTIQCSQSSGIICSNYDREAILKHPNTAGS